MNAITADENGRNAIEGGTLYLVATPIGNLDDLSARALKVLQETDFIAAEDTRVTGKLLAHYGIRASCVSYHEHNKVQSGEEILRRLLGGESCALVTDAGTPGISDPGADLCAACRKAGVKVTAVPGACAFVTALILSGLDTRAFCFLGFLDSGDKKKREEQLERLVSCTMTAILYEAPHRLRETLGLLYEALGDRELVLCRELTKLNEEVRSFTLAEAVDYYRDNEPRGEYVLVLKQAEREDAFWKGMEVQEHLDYYIDRLGMDRKTAMKQVARDRGMAKNEIYRILLDS